MPTLELTDQQVVERVQQLPHSSNRAALFALANQTAARRADRLTFAEDQLRRLCAARGRDWDQLAEDEREAFLDELVHEDRPCGP